MAKASPAIVSFNAGEWSRLLDGRTDLQKYSSACRICENFIPTVQGPARRRPGSFYVAGVKDHADRTWLVPFEFSSTQGYILEFGDLYIRFYTNRGQLNISAPAAWVTATAYAVGDLRSNGGTNYYCTTAHTSGVFATDLAAGKWHALSGTVYEIPSPYALADLTSADGSFALDFVQSGDVVYFTHPDYPVKKLSRYSATNWTMTEPSFVDGPFEDVNTDRAVTVYASASTGTGITLTASSAIFTSAHVGALILLESNPNVTITPWETSKAVAVNDLRRSDGNIYKSGTAATTGSIKPTHTEGIRSDGTVSWEYLHSGYGYARITGFTSGTVVTADVLSYIPSAAVGVGNATYKWAFGAWGEHAGYPTNCTFFRERLVFARGIGLWMSVSGDYESFASKDADQVTPDMAITITIASDQINDIVWLSPGAGLLVGTVGSEFIVGEISTQEALGPANIKASLQSGYGSRAIRALRVGETTLFVQKSGRKVRSMKYAFEQDNYVAADTNVLSDHITKGGVTATAYQSEPDSLVWCVRADGQLLGFTINQEQSVEGWHRHTIGGGVVESVACIASPTGDRDDLWMIVRRTINGATTRYVEYLGEYFEEGDNLADAFYVDSGATYSGAPATTISGLGHLEGETVSVLADGAAHPDRTVASGQITLQRAASTVQIGLGYQSTIKTMRLEAGAQDGTAQGKTKRVTRAAVRFIDTLGAKAGPDENTLDRIEFRSGSDPMDAPPPAFSGDKEIIWPSGYETDAHLTVVQDQPLPCTLVAIYPQVVTQDR